MSAALVTAQMLLIAALAWPTGVPSLEGRTAFGTILVVLAIALAFWALAAMRMPTFSVMPEPVAGGRLCRRGPYARLRHPMYSSVLLGGVGALLVWPVGWKFVAFVVLALVLVAKIRREERLLRDAYPDYDDYRRQTRAVIPGLL
ncbi:MAG: isoprenylcysteine carboxylmethyltransferase family protein [Burkholderiaceae bacterium]